jgi:pimeloyl-ACP methyl ester carboxylesterase
VGVFFCIENIKNKHEVHMSSPAAPGRTEIVNGQQIYFELHGSGEPLLLLHGFSGTSQDWLPSLSQWGDGFQIIVPDLRGHGRSGTLTKHFRHDDAAADVLALLDRLKIEAINAVGISGGGNVLLHMATKQPARVHAMVLVSATPYFPPQARAIMRRYAESLPEEQVQILRRRHPGGDAHVKAILDSTASFADSYDDLNFTSADLAKITARTLIVQGDRDPLYPVELSLEMAKAIQHSETSIIPDAGHGPVLGAKWPESIAASVVFLRA